MTGRVSSLDAGLIFPPEPNYCHEAGRGPSPEQTLIQRLRDYLNGLDERLRLPGEPPLREAVAQQARERLAEMDRTCGAHAPDRTCGACITEQCDD